MGNRLSSSGVPTYSYNPSNELTSNSSGSYTYDANGNTLMDPERHGYMWDFENLHALGPPIKPSEDMSGSRLRNA